MNHNSKYLLDVAKIFGVAFIGSLGFIWLLMEIYSHYELGWLPVISTNSLYVVILFCGSIIISLFFVLVRLLPNVYSQAVPLSSSGFEESLVEALVKALGEKHYAEVIRIGVALIRPLFEEGKFSTRLQIGKIVEEAAALSGRKDIQVVALIDAIGWSLVELGRYDDARRHIDHGINLSEEIKDVFYQAKGQRHLGVIARRSKDYPNAKIHYQASLDLARNLLDDHERKVLVAGLYYAFASLHYHMLEYDQAMEANNKAIASFEELNDEYRLNMSYVMKGDIESKLSQSDKAMDTFRTVLQCADQNTEKLQVVRARLGLAEICIAEHNWEKALHNVHKLTDVDLEEFKAEAERLKDLQARLPKSPVVA